MTGLDLVGELEPSHASGRSHFSLAAGQAVEVRALAIMRNQELSNKTHCGSLILKVLFVRVQAELHAATSSDLRPATRHAWWTMRSLVMVFDPL